MTHFRANFQLPAESGDQSSWTNQSKMPESMSGPISFLQLNLIIRMEAEPRCDPIHILFRPTSNMVENLKWNEIHVCILYSVWGTITAQDHVLPQIAIIAQICTDYNVQVHVYGRYRQLRARRVLSLLKAVLFRTGRVLYGYTKSMAIMPFWFSTETSLNSVNALMAFSQWYAMCWGCSREGTRATVQNDVCKWKRLLPLYICYQGP